MGTLSGIRRLIAMEGYNAANYTPFMPREGQ